VPMNKKLEVSFIETMKEEERVKKIVDILSDGFYEYLKAHGHLKKNPERIKKAEKLLEDSMRIGQDPA
jgi:hypothetical protein